MVSEVPAGTHAHAVGLPTRQVAAGKAAGAVGGAVKKGISNVKTGASNLANKVTLDKLMKTWKKMGEPKDTGSVVNILAGAGLTNDQITAIGSEQKVKLPKPI